MLVTWLKTYGIQTEKVKTRIQVRTAESPGRSSPICKGKWKQNPLPAPKPPNWSGPYIQSYTNQTTHMISAHYLSMWEQQTTLDCKRLEYIQTSLVTQGISNTLSLLQITQSYRKSTLSQCQNSHVTEFQSHLDIAPPVYIQHDIKENPVTLFSIVGKSFISQCYKTWSPIRCKDSHTTRSSRLRHHYNVNTSLYHGSTVITLFHLPVLQDKITPRVLS